MLAVALVPESSTPETLDGIGQAFFAALARDGGPRVVLSAALFAAGLFLLLVLWVSRETRRERREQEALDARHRAALEAAGRRKESRQWVRVAASVPMTVRHTDDRQRVVAEECKTENLSGGGAAFYSKRPPPPGLPVELTLDLGEGQPVALHAVVVRVEKPKTPGAPCLVGVGVRLSSGTTPVREQERLARWVAQTDARELAEARRGRVCARCGRPLAQRGSDVHEACVAATSNRPPPSRRSGSNPPLRRSLSNLPAVTPLNSVRPRGRSLPPGGKSASNG